MSIQSLALALPLALTPVLWPAAPSPQEADDAGAIQWRELAPSRPWLGVSLAGTGNLEITAVQPDSPAAAAGLRAGDRIASLDQEELEDFAALTAALSRRASGERVQLGIRRPITVAFSADHRAEDGRPLLGVYLEGNRITEVQEGQPAAAAGLEPGDRILAIDGERTASSDGIIARLRAAAGESAELLVGRRVPVELASRPAGLEAPEPVPAPLPPRGQRGFGWAVPPGQAPFPEAGDLRQELRSLSEEIAQLRAEIAALRAQIDALHAGSR